MIKRFIVVVGVVASMVLEIFVRGACDVGAELRNAAKKGYNWELQELVHKYPAAIDEADDAGVTPLMQALFEDNIKGVALLIQGNANLDAREKRSGSTALMIAAGNGKSDIVKLLLDSRSSIDLLQIDGGTALYAAVQEKHDVVVSLLLKAKANPLIGLKDRGITPLLRAAISHQFSTVKLLLTKSDAEEQLRARLYSGMSIFIAIIANTQKRDMIELLLTHSAQVIDDQDGEGNTPLMYAAAQNYRAIVGLLLEVKASVDLQNREGCTALKLAADKSNNEVMQQLIAARASVDIPSNRGYTALMCAANLGNSEAVEVLLAAKASPTLKSNDQCTAFAYANGAEPTGLLLLQAEQEKRILSQSSEAVSVEL